MTARVHRAALALVLAGLLPSGPRAQEGQPIYPAYDGFLKNPDGSYTLAFAYFSHNGSIVTVPAGPANQFGPGARDRMQPTVFKPGHWRFQCVMVVGPEFDGQLRWTLNYAGTSTGTSERMLQSNWNLVEGAAELGRIDYAKAPRGVCLNRPPTVRLLGSTARRGTAPALTATVGEDLHLFGSAHDEGLPRGRAFETSWAKVTGPGDVTFSPPASARARARFTEPGRYELELTATDSEFTERMRVVVTVH